MPEHRWPLLSASGHIDEISFIDPYSNEPLSGRYSIPKGAMLKVRGWAAITEDPGGKRGVYLRIDDGPPLAARSGIERPDVAKFFNDDAYESCGFRGLISTAHLSHGEHWLSIIFLDERGQEILVDNTGEASFMIDASLEDLAVNGPLSIAWDFITIDEVLIDGQPASPPIEAVGSSILAIRGWAVDHRDRNVGKAVFAVIGSTVIRGTYGIDRNDVALSLRDNRYRHSGFAVRVPLASLARGSSVLNLRMVGANGKTGYQGPSIPITVTSAGISCLAFLASGQMSTAHIDEAVAMDPGGKSREASPLSLARGDRLLVRGWAIDEPSRTVAHGVQVCIDDLPSTSAEYGLDRDDVAKAFSRPDLLKCGFRAVVSTESLEPGPHHLALCIIERGGLRYHVTPHSVAFTIQEPLAEVRLP